MENRLLSRNIRASLTFQITTVVCGFVLPRIIVSSFGSEVNGLVNSINQFLAIISFLELGVGAVVQSALYKPLAEKDETAISGIITSANKFFKNLAYIFLAYVIVLMILYPHMVNQTFGWVYIATLIASVAIGSFTQYYFGIVDALLLSADQKAYIQYNTQTITLILNTISCVVLTTHGAPIHIVKIGTSIIYLLRPFVLRSYVNHHYAINRRTAYKEEPIKQKWNGVAQHVAAIVLDSTDAIILSMFASLSAVSIYSVYSLVVNGIKQLFVSITHGIRAAFGGLWARKREKELRELFEWFEWLIHNGVVFIFGCTATLIVPFVRIYMAGVNDVNYSQPLFAVLLTIAHAWHCLRLPYNLMILAAGHFKQTQSNYIIAAGLNLIISIVTVSVWGLIGVTIGTLIAMLYQTIWMEWYNSKELLVRSGRVFIKQMVSDLTMVILGIVFTNTLTKDAADFSAWVILAVRAALKWGMAILIVNLLFYRSRMNKLLNKLFRNRITDRW